MKAFLLCPLIVLFFAVAEAHSGSSKFGEVSHDELTMKNYAADTSAAAVIVFDKGSTSLINTSTGYIAYKRHVRIKIFRKEAINDWASVTMFVERGTLAKLDGITYNFERDSVARSKIDENAIFKRRYGKYFDEINFTLPNVKEGSVIEYTYVIKGDVGVSPWQFQYSVPVVSSEYSVTLPTHYKLRHTLKGLLLPTYETKNGVQRWVLADVPAFKAEPLMPNKNDYVSQVEFSFSISTWEAVTGRLWGDPNFGGTVSGIVTGSSFLKKEAEKMTEGLNGAKEKIIAIHRYVRDALEWDGTEDIYAADDLKDNFKTKKGTAADINLTMAAMLHAAGVKVEMVLLSTRGNGFIRVDRPSVRQFNYAICRAYVDTSTYLLDATEKYLPWNVLPERCLNGIGLALSGEIYQWIDVESRAKDRTVATADLALENSGELKGKLSYTRSGYAAYGMRKSVLKNGKDRYVDDFKAGKQNWTILTTEFQNLEDLEKSVVETHQFSIQDHGISTDQMIYIDPFIIFREDENPFKRETRQFPIDFGTKSEKIYVTNITLPDGYSIDELPQPKVTALPGNKCRFAYTVTQTGNRLTVVSNIQINERIFMPEEYPALREFYNRIVAKQSEQIVLKKKG